MGVVAPKDNGYGTQQQTYTYQRYDSNGNAGPVTSVDYTFMAWDCYKSFNQVGGFIDIGHGKKFREPTSFERRVRQFNLTPGERRIYDAGKLSEKRTGFGVYGSLYDLPGRFLGNDGNIHSQSITECLNKLASKKVDLGTYLAEAVKSADMLAASALKLGQLLLNIKRGNLSRIPYDLGLKSIKRWREPANVYLQMKYGWRPLVVDLHNLYILSKEGLQKPMLLEAKRVVKTSQSGRLPEYLSDGGMDFKVDLTATCHLWALLDSKYLANMQSYGLANPLSLGWELTPFSFVLDWFVPVGAYLEALTATVGLNFVAGYTGSKREGIVEFDTNYCGHCSQPFFGYSRTKLNAFPFPQIYANENPFRTSNVLSALALFVQLAK